MATNMLTVITVLRDGRHVVHQTDAFPGTVSGVLVGAHIALREHTYRDEVARFVVIDRDRVTEHEVTP